MIKWNENVKMIISDVDETIADLYLKAEKEMIDELINLLREGKIIFFISGQSVKSISWRIVDYIPQSLRSNILIGHCSGCEVWGFNSDGKLNDKPYYSYYEERLSEEQRKKWREITNALIQRFELEKYDTMPISEFEKLSKGRPQAIMYEDRGPQITFEVVNGYQLSKEEKDVLNKRYNFETSDFRDPIIKEAEQLLINSNIPITPRKAGVFAIDFAIKGVSKTTAVKHVIEDKELMRKLGINNVEKFDCFEVWGDKFSVTNGGTDRHISEGLDKRVRTITFRKEDPSEFLEGYNIVVWDGEKHLHEGTLEYIKSRVKYNTVALI